MGLNGLGPSTSRLSGGCSNQLSYKPVRFIVSLVLTLGGDEGVRTPDPLLAGQVLSQLSYTPIPSRMGSFSLLEQNTQDYTCLRVILSELLSLARSCLQGFRSP